MWIRFIMIALAILPVAVLVVAPYVEAAVQPFDPRGGALPQGREQAEELWNQVSQEKLKATVEKLVGFGTRNSLSTKGIGQAREWLKGELEKIAKSAKAPMTVEFHEFTDSRLKRSGELVAQKNVFATLKGKKYPKQVVVFGAHYDSINLKERENPDATAPGANDNSSGTAAVLEAARILSQVEHDRTIIFAAFSSEEQGLIGAWHFAKFLKESGLEVVAMLNNDIVGGAKDDAGKPLNVRDIRCFSIDPQEGDSRRLARLAKIVVESRLKDFKVLLQDRVDRPGRGGDHQSFNKVGFTAIRFIEGVETDKVHHTPDDTIDRIHFPYHALAVKADIALVANLANAPEAPEAPELSTPNEKGVLARWKPVEGARRYLIGVRRGGLEFVRIVECEHEGDYPSSVVEDLQVCVAAVDGRGNVSLFSAESQLRR